ncbi:ATP-dependent DNA helicase Q5 [Strongyloides ratti]|uniref:ATP-dependent DNA helicase n=1 Tax=Strongyloides ratti TaxID=34506 RepID=A0A090LL80_STRRB|nr:ATP-dependent DNA helicase Q5 [Strongyloides ratti]CEF68285.1 ATP-dependent DNA helicase Q5 [Strongyloides ratti]
MSLDNWVIRKKPADDKKKRDIEIISVIKSPTSVASNLDKKKNLTTTAKKMVKRKKTRKSLKSRTSKSSKKKSSRKSSKRKSTKKKVSQLNNITEKIEASNTSYNEENNSPDTSVKVISNETEMKELDEYLVSSEFLSLTNEKRSLCILKKIFNHEAFRSKEQKKAIFKILEGDSDIYISFPTGAGKSLCYQLPSLCKPGVTIVFSPLLALINDQINSLIEKNVRCCQWNSSISKEDREQISRNLFSNKPNYHIVFTTPESGKNLFFREILKSLFDKKLLNYLVIDESHCVSQWGHDFRPDYLKLCELKDLFPSIPLIALTATASEHVEEDIRKNLKLSSSNCKTFRISPFRKNLYYDVIMAEGLPKLDDKKFGNLKKDEYKMEQIKKDVADFINKLITHFKKEKGSSFNSFSGIIYCRSRNQCEEMAGYLSKKAISAKVYHSRIRSKEKIDTQKEWMDNKITVICATIAFGMGIDKSDVRFVIHMSCPDDLAAYYQETGRAGRDGKRSYCRLYHSISLKKRAEFFNKGNLGKIEKSKCDENSKKMKKQNLSKSFEKMMEYCENECCRHKMLCEYFGDKNIKSCKNNCDFCREPQKVKERIRQYHNDEKTCDLKTGIGEKNPGPFKRKQVDNEDLYGGGKYGYQKEIEYYKEPSRQEIYRMEKNEKEERFNLIKGELAKRKKFSDINEKKVSNKEENPDDFKNLTNPHDKKFNEYILSKREKVRENIEKAIKDAYPNLEERLKKSTEYEYKLYSESSSKNGYISKSTGFIVSLKKNIENNGESAI